uniref:Uncharacterized protein n=1 Tax=Anguilla anguilla TaxID=7936 RepID=A0A0E9RTH8_ANGAN
MCESSQKWVFSCFCHHDISNCMRTVRVQYSQRASKSVGT